MVFELVVVSQDPTNEETCKDKFSEILSLVDPNDYYKKCVGSIPSIMNKSKDKSNISKSLVSSNVNKLTVSNNLGILLLGKVKPLIYSFLIKSSTIQTQPNKGAQMTSLGNLESQVSNIKVIDEGDVSILIITIKEKIFLWQISSSNNETETEHLATLTNHSKEISSIKLTSDNQFLISASLDSYINIYSIYEIIEQGNLTTPIINFKANELEIVDVYVIHDNSQYIRIAATGNDHYFRIWDFQVGVKDSELGIVHNESLKIDFDDRVVLFTMDSNMMNAYFVKQSNQSLIYKCNTKTSKIEHFKSSSELPIKQIEMTLDNRKILSLDNVSLKIWDTRMLVLIKNIDIKAAQSFCIHSPIPNSWFQIGNKDKKFLQSKSDNFKTIKMPKFLARG